MHHVADALKWLHGGITMVGNSNPIRFAHMDLKPNNILIDSDDGYSAVGKWVLTDFGISAFKEDDGADADNLMSIRDYYQNLTINTTPRRDSGAYQPPEVEHMSIDPSERRSPEQGSVGRRGDIWSFACIFTEVLAFSLGQAALLKEFRTVRKGKHPNDYFYESYELQDEALHPYGKQVSFRVRPQIIQWLRALPARYSFPKKAIDCCVETIQRVLIVDGSRRPKAYELMKLFNHVASHIDSARAPGGPPPNCPLEARTPSEPLLVTSRSTRGPPTPFPPIQIKRTNTKDEEELLTQQSPRASSASVPLNVLPSPEHEQLGHDPQHTNDVYVRRDDVSPILRNTPVPIRDRDDSFLEHGSPLQQSVSGLGIFADPTRTASISEATQMPIRSRPSSRSSRRDLHGVMINQDRVRKMGGVAELALVDRSRRLVSVSLSPSGRHVAYLVEDKKSRYAIHTFTARTECQKAASRLVFHALNSIALPTGTKWEGVVANEAHLVAWGNIRAGSKQASKP
jgi:serine/threonine protein kinase